MSRLHKVERHRRSLAEIRDVMNSVKSLAYIEVRKLGRLASAQRTVTEQIELAAADFLSFHPTILPRTGPATKAIIVIGSERGLCGDFNRRLVTELQANGGPFRGDRGFLLAVGRKLHSVLEAETDLADEIVFVDGASVVDEVAPALNLVVDELDSLQQRFGLMEVSSIHHDSQGDILRTEILPPFAQYRNAPRRYAHAPLLNLPPPELLVELADQYLVACLYEILYASMTNENQRRVSHLGDAVKHLDDKSARLAHRVNALRQEEITEEIEVILLSATSLGGH